MEKHRPWIVPEVMTDGSNALVSWLQALPAARRRLLARTAGRRMDSEPALAAMLVDAAARDAGLSAVEFAALLKGAEQQAMSAALWLRMDAMLDQARVNAIVGARLS
ncbi:MAG: hypothetical protein RIB32_02765 [Phycisphaerales bacterium]